MKKVLVVGSINLDLVFECSNLPVRGETIISEDHNRYFGGKGANQAVGLSRLGVPTKMFGCVGNDFYGQVLINNLKNNNIDISGIKISKDKSSGLAIVIVDRSGNNQIVVSSGANYDITELDMNIIEKYILESDIVLCQLEIPVNIVEKIMIYAKQHGKITVLNPAPARELSDEIYLNCDFLIPNEVELSFLAELQGEETTEFRLKKLLDKGCKNVIATLGDKGAMFANNNSEIKYYDAHKVKAIDTTGAGDSFIAGFLYGLATSLSVDESIMFASKVAAITVTRKGAQDALPNLSEVNGLRIEN